MPEFTNSRVGSSLASSGAGGTRVWPRSSKKRWKRSRMSAELIGSIGLPAIHDGEPATTGSHAACSGVWTWGLQGLALGGVELADHAGARPLGLRFPSRFRLRGPSLRL